MMPRHVQTSLLRRSTLVVRQKSRRADKTLTSGHRLQRFLLKEYVILFVWGRSLQVSFEMLLMCLEKCLNIIQK